MDDPVRPQTPDPLDALIASRQAALAGPAPAPSPPHDVDALIASRQAALGAPSTPKPGIFSRALDQFIGGATQAIEHPINTIQSLASAPIKSAFNAVVAPGVGEARPDARLSKGGNSSGRAIDTTPYDAAHGAVTPAERTAAGVQTVANVAFPSIVGSGRLASLGVPKLSRLAFAGGTAGAAYNPNDPGAGALSGAALALGFHGVSETIGGTASAAIDASGRRPMESRPIIKAGPVSIGRIEGVSDRAARLNANALSRTPLPTPSSDALASGKPLAAVDLGGVPAARLARGLKTSSPAAEAVIRDALQPRADAAVDRVIQHGLEATGLQTRESGLQVVDDLIAQRAQHGRENFQPVFAAHPDPMTDPEFGEIAQTPAGKQAAKRGGIIAANRGETIGSVPEIMGAPEGIDPEAWARKLEIAKERGMTLPTVPGADKLAPTLQQAHYIKLGFDDMLNSAPEPGSGGTGPNNAAAIRTLKNRWLAAMDRNSEGYATARKTFADESDLVRAAELGRKMWSVRPDVLEKEFGQMSTAERDVARRAGFDGLADRVENGPVDVERGVSKPRDQRRMRLLFPDQQSFANFQQGLSHEAQMHATTQGVLGGSNTADKFADIADMAGVTLPDVVRTMATGRWHQLVGRAAANLTRKAMTSGSDALSSERARLLVAGANGDASARTSALSRMGFPTAAPVAPIASSGQSAERPPLLRLPAGRFETGDMQGSAMPIPQPVPRSRWLGPGTTYPAVAGDVQQGAAMPIPQPLPFSRRLMSGGQPGVPTAGDMQMGPGIPTPGQQFEGAVRDELMRLYRKRPALAVSMTPEDQARLEAQVRARLVSPHAP